MDDAMFGTQFAANLAACKTFSESSVLRLFVVGGGTYVSGTAFASTAADDLGEWWDTPAARATAAFLELKRDNCPVPTSSDVRDLLYFVANRDDARLDAQTRFNAAPKVLRSRRVLVCREHNPVAGVTPPDGWREMDTSQHPCCLLLTHTFEVDASSSLPDLPIGSRLTLKTIFLDDRVWEAKAEDVAKDVWGGRTPALFAPLETASRHHALTTDVLVYGAPLSPPALAALRKPSRELVLSCRRSAVLHTLAACVTASSPWAGRFLALRHFAEETEGLQERWETEPLAAQLISGRVGGRPTVQLQTCRVMWAQAAVARGEIDTAFALHRAMLKDHAADKNEKLLPCGDGGVESEHLVHYSLACSLMRSERWGDAKKVLGDALRALRAHGRADAMPARTCRHVSPLFSCRLHARTPFLRLGQVLHATLECVRNTGGMRRGGTEANDLLIQMLDTSPAFVAARREVGRGEVRFHLHEQGGRILAEVTPERRHLPTRAFVVGEKFDQIIEVAPGFDISAPINNPRRAAFDLSAAEACMAPLPPRSCASCGRRAANRCGGCKRVHYCSTACQRKDWAAHAPACRSC